MAIALSFFVIYPIFQTKTKKYFWSKDDFNHRAMDLEERKEAIYATIKEIEFDYQMGKLSEEDFKELRQKYKEEAIGLLKKIDQIQRKHIKSRRVHSIQKQKQKSVSKAVNFCWICGTAVTAKDKFCVNCGNKLD